MTRFARFLPRLQLSLHANCNEVMLEGAPGTAPFSVWSDLPPSHHPSPVQVSTIFHHLHNGN